MIVAANQPYLFPYLGYFQLIAAADVFVFYDSMQYVKRSWINRNRMLVYGEPALITSPVLKGDRYAAINERFYTRDFLRPWLDICRYNYVRAAFYNDVMNLLESLITDVPTNVAEFNIKSIRMICDYISLTPAFKRLSELMVLPDIDKSDKTISVVKALGGTEYYNLPGGRALYSADYFANRGIELKFLNPALPAYHQLRADLFQPALSILDVMMNCSPGEIRNMIAMATFD